MATPFFVSPGIHTTCIHLSWELENNRVRNIENHSVRNSGTPALQPAETWGQMTSHLESGSLSYGTGIIVRLCVFFSFHPRVTMPVAFVTGMARTQLGPLRPQKTGVQSLSDLLSLFLTNAGMGARISLPQGKS